MFLLQVMNFPLVVFDCTNQYDLLFNSSFCSNIAVDVDAPSIADRVIHDQAAPEPPVMTEVVLTETTCPANTTLPDPTVLPEDAAQETAPELTWAPSSSIPIATSVEGVVVSSFKDSLLMASQFESHLRELSSQAKIIKTNMHVSTYVSFLTHWV